MSLLKIGNRIINTQNIAMINLSNNDVSISFNVTGFDGNRDVSDFEKTYFTGEEAKALRWWVDMTDEIEHVSALYEASGKAVQK